MSLAHITPQTLKTVTFLEGPKSTFRIYPQKPTFPPHPKSTTFPGSEIYPISVGPKTPLLHYPPGHPHTPTSTHPSRHPPRVHIPPHTPDISPTHTPQNTEKCQLLCPLCVHKYTKFCATSVSILCHTPHGVYEQNFWKCKKTVTNCHVFFSLFCTLFWLKCTLFGYPHFSLYRPQQVHKIKKA